MDRYSEVIYRSMALWDLPEMTPIQLLNISENHTYLIKPKNREPLILRVHRPGYHSYSAICSELAWMQNLSASGVTDTPKILSGANGNSVQSIVMPYDQTPLYMVMFSFVAGANPDSSVDLKSLFTYLGSLAARMHTHVSSWKRPEWFHRQSWDITRIFGGKAIWGNWRHAPKVTGDILSVLELAQFEITKKIEAYGSSSDRFGLIHADMRLANILVCNDRNVLIDFDDCGFGWFMYDFAASVSFIEDNLNYQDLKQSWVQGYRYVMDLSKHHELELDTFVMLRRMALLAWIGSHIESTEPQKLAPTFARNTAILADRFLTTGTIH